MFVVAEIQEWWTFFRVLFSNLFKKKSLTCCHHQHMSDDSDDSDVASTQGSPSTSQSSRKTRNARTTSASSPMLRQRKQPAATILKSKSAMLRAPKPGAILRSQLSHLDDVHWRIISQFPRPADLPLPITLDSDSSGAVLRDSDEHNPEDQRREETTPSRARTGMMDQLSSEAQEERQREGGSLSPSTASMRSPTSPLSRYPPSSPQFGRTRDFDDAGNGGGNLRQSNSLASGLTKLRRGANRLRILSEVGSPTLASKSVIGSTEVPAYDNANKEVKAIQTGRKFAHIMQRRASRLKMLQDFEKEKRKGAAVRAAWAEDMEQRRSDDAAKAAEEGKVKTPLERLRSVVKNNREGLKLVRKVDMLSKAAKVEEGRHKQELEQLKHELTHELENVGEEREVLVQQLKEAKNAPVEMRRQMEQKLHQVQEKLQEKQRELENQRDQVHKELVGVHEAEKKNIVERHKMELEAMHASLDSKQKELEIQNLTKEELAVKVEKLKQQKAEVENFLEAQKEAALASQGEQMANGHLRELQDVEDRLARREKEMQEERDRLETKIDQLQNSSELEKIELRDQLMRMQDQLLENEADLRSHKQVSTAKCGDFTTLVLHPPRRCRC